MGKQADKQRRKAAKQFGLKATKGKHKTKDKKSKGEKQREQLKDHGTATPSGTLSEQLGLQHQAVRDADPIVTYEPLPKIDVMSGTEFCLLFDNSPNDVKSGSYELVPDHVTIEQLRSRVGRLARRNGRSYSTQKRRDNLIVRLDA